MAKRCFIFAILLQLLIVAGAHGQVKPGDNGLIKQDLFQFLANNVHQHGPDMDKLLKGQMTRNQNKPNPNPKQNGWSLQGFWTSLAMILVSEIGDKTFFIAAILAMKHSRFIVWVGAAGALFVMTVMAVVAGSILQVVPVSFTHYGAAFLFLAFGVKLLYEAHGMKGGEASDELREAEEELLEAEKKILKEREKKKRKNVQDIELGQGHPLDETDSYSNGVEDQNTHLKGKKLRDRSWDFAVLVRAFVMTFISEIGDRSQITTIVLASHKSPLGVTVGASLGHAICTAIAVLGGKVLASRISEKNVALIGGVLFLVFSVESFLYGPIGDESLV